MNAVLIPCFRRPEFLRECLRNIALAEGADRIFYIFRLDYGFDPLCLDVIKGFPLQHRISYTPKTPWTLTKQSYSVLTGLVEASQIGELVYLIEDDVIIGKDFFQWHEAAHRKELFSSHANLNINTTQVEGRWDEAYLTHNAYSSIGTCIPSKVIHNLIRPCLTESVSSGRGAFRYLKHPMNYVRARFPKSTLGVSMCEQDGLIRRLQEEQDLPQAYPCHQYIDGLLYGPRCYHAGFVGKNRKRTALIGSHEEKHERVVQTIYSTELMKAECGDLWQDSVPCALELPQWQNLHWKN